MSVWPSVPSTHSPALRGSDGELVSVSVTVEPRDLEDLLEALAALDFPVNPQIYHDAAVVWIEANGNERVDPTTIVEFPAYAAQLPKVRQVLDRSGLGGDAMSVHSMLDDLHGNDDSEPVPAGRGYKYRVLKKHAGCAPAGSH